MSVIPLQFSKTSEDGVNSYGATSGALWAGNIWTGAGERNDYAYVGVNLQTDAVGTLTFEFSQDGTNWSKYPVTEFAIASGINEVHTAWKGGRYIRPKFTGDPVGPTAFFRIQTYYSNHPLPLSAPLNQSIGTDQDATVVRAVSTGQEPDGTYTNARIDGVAFRTGATLGIGATYTSPITSTEGYSQIETHLFSDVAGTLTGTWYADEAKTQVIRTFTRPYANDEVGSVSYFSAPVFGPYLEYQYVNGATAQSAFFLDFHPRTKAISGQVLGMNDFIPAGVVANLGRSVLVGQDKAGNFKNMPIDSEAHIKVNLHDPLTGFGQVKVAEETPVIQVQFPYNLNSNVVAVVAGTGGTAYQANSMLNLETGATANTITYVETNEAVKYEPGEGGIVRFTGVFTTGVTGSSQLIGIGDANDGYFIGYVNDQFGIVRRQNGTDFFTPQTEFTEDKIDGSRSLNNPSAINIDPTKGNVFQIKYKWLGFGAITFSMEDPDSGDVEPFHIIKYSNRNVIPSVFNPTLPLRWEVQNTTNATNLKISTASAMAAIEGDRKISGPTYAISLVGSTTALVASLRNKSTYQGKTNRVRVFLKLFTYANDGTSKTTYTIHENSTLTGDTGNYIDVDAEDSVIEYVDGATATINTDGKLLTAFVAPKGTGDTVNLQEFEFTIAPGKNITIKASNTNSTDIALTWTEDI